MTITKNIQCLTVLFEQSAKQLSTKPALISDSEILTYGQLNQCANQLAHYLSVSGLRANQLTALYLRPSIAAIIVILAILKAGGCYLPLDFDAPKNYNNTLLEESNISFMIVQSRNDLAQGFFYLTHRQF